MPQAGTQLNGKLSRRGRQSEGRPTKRIPEMVARIAEAIIKSRISNRGEVDALLEL
jgi:hypothetical protein